MADVEEGAAAPNQRQGQNQQQTSSKRIKMQQNSNIYI